MIRQRVKAGLKQRRIRSKALLTIGAAYGGHDEITDAVRALLCGAATLFRDRECDATAQLVVGDSKNTITLARSSADVSPPYGFMCCSICVRTRRISARAGSTGTGAGSKSPRARTG